MRRTDREITDFSQMVEIMKHCGVCNVSFSDEYPYVVPMNFGMKIDGEEITLYFHGAGVGRKHDLVKKIIKSALLWKICFLFLHMILLVSLLLNMRV